MGPRKDLLLGRLVVFLLGALCVFELWEWAVGIETPEEGTPKRWIALVGSVLILGAIVFLVALLSYECITNALREKGIMQTSFHHFNFTLGFSHPDMMNVLF